MNYPPRPSLIENTGKDKTLGLQSVEPQAGHYELGDRTVPPRPAAQWPRRPGYCVPSTVWWGGLLNQDGQGSPRRSGVGVAGL